MGKVKIQFILKPLPKCHINFHINEVLTVLCRSLSVCVESNGEIQIEIHTERPFVPQKPKIMRIDL